jgi:adenosylcobinamide-GDP ribazoletransferase
MLTPFLIAVQFLSTIPVKINAPVSDRDLGRSLLFYPLVGVVFAVLLIAMALLLQTQDQLVSAALLLISWVLLTGGLHLDGLADSADAWLGGIGSRDKTLAIMKDPLSGPFAVTVLVLLLLLKFVLLLVIINDQNWTALFWSIILARTALPLLFLTTPYVRAQGLGAKLKRYQPAADSRKMLAIVAVLAILSAGFGAVLAALAIFLLLRFLMEKRLNGFTGDTAGAMVEIMEAALLTFFVLTIG